MSVPTGIWQTTDTQCVPTPHDIYKCLVTFTVMMAKAGLRVANTKPILTVNVTYPGGVATVGWL